MVYNLIEKVKKVYSFLNEDILGVLVPTICEEIKREIIKDSFTLVLNGLVEGHLKVGLFIEAVADVIRVEI